MKKILSGNSRNRDATLTYLTAHCAKIDTSCTVVASVDKSTRDNWQPLGDRCSTLIHYTNWPKMIATTT